MCNASNTASRYHGPATPRRAPLSKTPVKKSRPLVQAVATAYPQARVELWAMDFTDEHRIGLKPLVRRMWAPMGQRPIGVVEHRYRWHSLVGFVHPASGRTVWHLASGVSIPLFETELAAFAQAVGASPRKQIVLVLDQAGWHTSERFRVPSHPEHVHLLFLPPYSPELQLAEQLGPLTNEALVNARFDDMDALEDAQLAHCAALQQRPTSSAQQHCFSGGPSVSINARDQGGTRACSANHKLLSHQTSSWESRGRLKGSAL